MTARLRVLEVEDSESDAALTLRLLEKAGYDVVSERVEGAEGMRAALARRTWDVIIADYRLPGFDAAGALRVLHETGEDIPFIVVSANIGEALAVELMRSGAHDYVMKDNLARLAPAVEREVREARARRERREAEERLALAITATQLGTFDYYPQTRKLIWSDIAKQQFGLSPESEVSCESFLAGLHAEDRERVDGLVRQLLRPGGGGKFASEFRTVGIEDRKQRTISASGEVFFDAQDRPVRVIGVMVDISERRRLEDQFRQAQKLESVGRLAGGVAHDFNNLLTVITGYAQMALDELAPDHPLRDPIDEIAGAAQRAAKLTRKLLTFSRRQLAEPKNLVLNDVVRDLDKMLRRLIGANIDLQLALDPAAGMLRADPGQIEQVIVNLVVNGQDAMPNGGRLLIETGRQQVDDQFLEWEVRLAPGPYVSLTVSDTGTGMSAEVKAHVFEPFFTTKERGKGTGLGLSTVYGIVQQSGGGIWLYSEPGRGTTFKMLFPAVEGAREEIPKQQAESSPAGTETILLAEDEPGLREFIRRSLASHGYSVLPAGNGREALEVARRHEGEIHALITDIVMPEMSGVELARHFAVERQGAKVLMMSGYTDQLLRPDEIGASYIQKPFTAAAVLSRLRSILEA